ncbi:hypothetical protein NKI94_19300 [Mesorhizobium australicum]|uniref:hypothetical protein n=1 Tax=Mesorhizobium australicum TaxID=536018 RepID=UPI003339FDC8
MAKRSLASGGTSGAQVSFALDPPAVDRVRAICPPGVEWIERFEKTLPGFKYPVERVFEACGERFLRRKVTRLSRSDQGAYLGELQRHLSGLFDLLVRHPQFSFTAADPIQFFEGLDQKRGLDRRRDQILGDLIEPILQMQTFAAMQLRAMAGKQPVDVADTLRRRNDFPRLVLIADIIAQYKMVTGKEPTAYATDEYQGPAVELVCLLVPLVLRAARVEKRDISPQSAKLEIAAIKKAWENGARPELAYSLPSWPKVG